MSKIKFYKDSAKTQQVYPELDPEDITKFESLEDIENAFPNVSGENTNITLNHTVEAPMRLELAPSELWQETTTGKNLLSNIQLTTSTTKNGVTFTPVFDENGLLEYVNVNGTATEQTTQAIVSFVPEVGVSYKVNGSPTNSSMSNAYVYVTGSISSYGGNDTSASWSTAGEKSYQIIVINGATINNMKFYPMIRLATETDATYEPYTNGAKPNPDFPSQVHSVSGDNEIKINGKNLVNIFDINAFKYGNGGGSLSVVSQDETITTTSNYSSIRSKGILIEDLKHNTDYTISFIVDSIETSSTRKTYELEAIAYNSDDTYNKYIFQQTYSKIGLIEVAFNSAMYDKIAVHISGWYGAGNTGTLTYHNLMVETGSSFTNYVPYQSKSLLVSLGDLEYCKIGEYKDEFIKSQGNNYFDKEAATIGKNWNGSAMAYSIISDYIDVIPGEIYRLSVSNMGNFSSSVIVALDENKSLITNYANGITNPLPDGTRYIMVSLRCASSHVWTQTELDEAIIMFNKGATALPYEPYGSGKWYLKKNIGKVALEDYNFGVYAAFDGYKRRITTEIPNIKYVSVNTELGSGIAEKYLNHTGAGMSGVGAANCFAIDVSMFQVTIPIETNPSGSFYYALAIPQYILLNDTLQQQLEDIYNWVESYPGQTNISQINNDLPFIISAHAMKDLSVIDKYPTENSEHLVESGGVYEVVKVQNEHTAQIKELQRTSLIYNAMPKVAATGTDLTINDTAECPLELALSGNVSQETTTGIQCFNKASINPAASSIVSQLDTGIKLKNAWATNALTNASIVEQLKPDTTYSCRVIENITSRPETMTEYQVSLGLYRPASGDIPSTFIVLINDNSAKRTAPLNTDIEYVKTFTTPSDLANLSLLSYTFMTSSGASGTIELKDLMIVEGSYTSSDFPDYEQFTGETSSPNPLYSQNINVVNGSNEIYIQNQNKLTAPYTSYTQTKNGMTLSYNTSNEHNLTGTATASTSIAVGNLLKYYTIQNNDYLHLCNNKIPTGTIQIVGVSSTNGQIFANTINSRNHIVNLSPYAGKILGHLQFYFVSGASVTDMIMTPMILNGVSAATNYIEHKEQSLSLNLPVENLVSSHTIGNNIILLNNATSTTDYVFNPGTYTISAKGTNLVSVYYKAASGNQTRLGNLSDLPITINAAENFNIWFYYVGMVEGDVYDIQLEQGTKANSYTPFGTTPIELCKIGDYEDEFYLATESDTSLVAGKWYLKKNIGKVVLDGSESWNGYTTLDTETTTWFQMTALDNALAVLSITNSYLYSNNFTIFNCYNPSPNQGLCYHSDKKIQIRILTSLLSDASSLAKRIESFKNWLSTHNTDVYYILATPEYTLLNDTLQQQLNDIAEAISYQDQTNISQTNNDLPFTITATAVQDINKLIATLTNAIIEIGGE